MHQETLFGRQQPRFSLGGLRRIPLDDRSWVEHRQGALAGAEALFDEIVRGRPWKQRTRRLYDKEVLEPRLTAPWREGEPLLPIVEEMRTALGARYGVRFSTIGFNYYRDGNDSVAWHRDQIPREIEQPVVALLSLGAPRKLLLRPRGGGRSLPFLLSGGDLLVTGGYAQREWEHTIPKVAHAEPRISLAFRHGMYGSD